MGLQGGEERVFPVQLMTVRRNRNGVARSVFLSGQGGDHCISVIEAFSRCLGKSRGEIEKELKVLELKSQNPKILRGLSLLMFRISRMDKPSLLDPLAVREAIFRHSRTPAVTGEERKSILSVVALEMNASLGDIESAIYADQEGNEILGRVADISPEALAGLYNIEQIETVMLKAQFMDIATITNRNRFVRRIRSLGLLYSEEELGGRHLLRVSGPVSILEHSERYGSRFAFLIRYILKFQDWEIDARVTLRKGGENEEFAYHLDESVSEFTGSLGFEEESLPNFVMPNPDQISLGTVSFYPDYLVHAGSRNVNIFLSTPKYYMEDRTDLGTLIESGNSEVICIIVKGEKCPRNARCFRDKVDWFTFRDVLASDRPMVKDKTGVERNPEARREAESSNSEKHMSEEVINHLKALYPDSEAMVNYLDFMGFSPVETLEQAGYRVTWKGLMIDVQE